MFQNIRISTNASANIGHNSIREKITPSFFCFFLGP